MARRTLAWELGRRDDATCRRLLDRVGIEGNAFLTDDWEGFHRLIPEGQLFTGKDLTFGIEQDNSDVRHHLARFRRRSKVTSRARHMVDGALRLLCHLRQPENFLPTASLQPSGRGCSKAPTCYDAGRVQWLARQR